MQPESSNWNNPDAVQEGTDSVDDVIAALTDLIAEIEAAPAGSEALDARIHFSFCVMVGKIQDHASLLIGEGISWPTVKAVLEDMVAPFTTSLDASLEGERIVFVLYSAKRRRWGAMQRAACGEEVLGWAKTEPLARRLAALKSWRADLLAALKEQKARASREAGGPAKRATPQSDKAPSAQRSRAKTGSGTGTDSRGETGDESGDETGRNKDWEVLF